MIKKFFAFIFILFILIAGFMLMNTDQNKIEEDSRLQEEINFTKIEETDPLIFEVRKAIKRGHRVFTATSREELEETIRNTWSEPEFALEMYADVIDWILTRETPFTKVDTQFANETMTSTEQGDFITYTATVTINLYSKSGEKYKKTFTGIFNIVKDEKDHYKIQNLQLLQPAENNDSP